MRKIALIVICVMLPLSIAACSYFSSNGLASNMRECVAQGGDWTSFELLYRDRHLSNRDSHRFYCNMRTTDAGKICTGRINQCEGYCLAPGGTKVGELAAGRCSTNVVVPDDLLLIENGKVINRFSNIQR